MNSKFIKLWESSMQRFTRGGFSVGDFIEFIKNYKSHNDFKALNPEMQKELEDMINSNLHIRVVNIKDVMPTAKPGNVDNMNGNNVVLDIAADHGGGRHIQQFTVPTTLITRIDVYPNVAPKIPEGLVRPNKTIIKPEEYTQEDNEEIAKTHQTMQGNSMKKADTSLLNKNVKIPAKEAEGAKSPAISYTINYMKS
jgi:hypothetical protein